MSQEMDQETDKFADFDSWVTNLVDLIPKSIYVSTSKPHS
jgi:hypothetical protein